MVKKKDLFIKKFTDIAQYEHFMQRVYATTGRRDMIMTSRKKMTIYDPNKNRIYIKCEDGIVRDITEVSAKIRNYSMDLCLIMIDVSPIYCMESEAVKNIRILFENNPIEIEKKFEFPKEGVKLHWTEDIFLNNLKHILSQMNTVERMENDCIANNNDTYFKLNCMVQNGIAIRRRKTDSGESYFIKIPLDDGTSITKREEYEYKNTDFDEFSRLATLLFKSKNFITGEESLTLKEWIKIKTERHKLLITVCGSIIEIACDFSTYEYDGKIAKDNMLECELKKGDDLALWCLTNHLKKFGFLQMCESKETRATKALGLN